MRNLTTSWTGNVQQRARASFLASVEPLFAALLAMMLLGQFLSPTEWIGFFIVLLSIFMFEKLAPKTG